MVAPYICRRWLGSQRAGARGRFLLSINDRPEVRECFAAFRVQPIETTWTIGTRETRTGKVGELLISNFETAPIAPS